MNIKKSLVCAILSAAFSSFAFGWGGTGHSAVAYVAEKHLTPKAKAALDKILDGKSLHEIASDADKYRPEWVHDIGRKIENPSSFRFARWGDKFNWTLPTNIEPYPHSFSATVDCEPFPDVFDTKDGKTIGVVNCVYYVEEYSREIKSDRAKMDPKDLSVKVRLLVHWLGDMHCPGHVGFIGENVDVKGSTTPVVIRGKKTTMHKFWDGGIFSMGFPGMKADAVADMAEGYEKVKFSKKSTRGTAWDWARSSAKVSHSSRIYNGTVVTKGFEFPDTYPEESVPVCLRQIRDGGYRLAALLNDIFK